MSYESEAVYLKVFDATQSPCYMDMLGARFGYAAPIPEGSSESNRVYLDLGCAAGRTILALAPLYPQIRFLGVDFNVNHIAQARMEAQRLGLDNAEFVHGDFRNLPALPAARYITVRGIYSWLAPEVRSSLDRALAFLAAPGCFVKLHHAVRPGMLQREAIGQLFQVALPEGRTPAEGRKLCSVLYREAKPLLRDFANASPMLEDFIRSSDELWQHDFLNEDFKVENAHEVLERLQHLGLCYVAATAMERNLPAYLVTEPIAKLAATLSPLRAQTLIDYVTNNGSRDDLLVREPAARSADSYDLPIRFGLVVPVSKSTEPHQTTLGQILFQREECRNILAHLEAKPRDHRELQSLLPGLSRTTLDFWLDLLLAGGKIGPFLPATQARDADRERIRRLNREHLAMSMETFSNKTTTPLLAAEYGNCLVAGWFETLVLQHFDRRHVPAVQQRMLTRIHQARMGFPGPDGKPARDQLAVFRQELEKLEVNYLSRMGYWGIEV